MAVKVAPTLQEVVRHATSSSTAMGRFAWNTTTGAWHWDAGMFAIHG